MKIWIILIGICLLIPFWLLAIWLEIRKGNSREQKATREPSKTPEVQSKTYSTKIKDVPDRFIECDKCDGYYILRLGKYGFFAGCSNFNCSNCRSTISLKEYLKRIIRKYGVNIYTWNGECEYCGAPVTVRSYYLTNNYQDFIPYFEQFASDIGIGDIVTLDALLADKYDNIRLNSRKRFAVCCNQCKKPMSHNSVVSDPHGDIWGAVMTNEGMEEFLLENIKIDKENIVEDIVECIFRNTGIDKMRFDL